MKSLIPYCHHSPPQPTTVATFILGVTKWINWSDRKTEQNPGEIVYKAGVSDRLGVFYLSSFFYTLKLCCQHVWIEISGVLHGRRWQQEEAQLPHRCSTPDVSSINIHTHHLSLSDKILLTLEPADSDFLPKSANPIAWKVCHVITTFINNTDFFAGP